MGGRPGKGRGSPHRRAGSSPAAPRQALGAGLWKPRAHQRPGCTAAPGALGRRRPPARHGAPRGADAAGFPEAAGARSPVTFSTWPCRSSRQHKQAPGRAQLGLRPASGPGAPVDPITTGRRAANPGAARSRPLAAEAPGSGWGRGERGAQARSPRPAGFARGPRHAPRARSTWPGAASAPLTLETRSLRAARARPPRDLRASLSGPLDASTAGLHARAPLSAFGGQSPAGGRPEVRGAFAVPQPEAVGDARSTGLFIAPGGKAPCRESNVRAGEGRPSPHPTSSRAAPGGGRLEPLRRSRAQAPLRRGSHPWEKARGDATGIEVKETPR